MYLAIFAVLCVLAGVLVGAGITRCQHMRWPGQKHYGYNRGERGNLIEMLAKELDLNQGQKEKVRAILEKTRREIDAAGKEIRSKIIQIKEKSDQEISVALTLEQQEKFRAMQEEFKKIHKNHVRGGKR